MLRLNKINGLSTLCRNSVLSGKQKLVTLWRTLPNQVDDELQLHYGSVRLRQASNQEGIQGPFSPVKIWPNLHAHCPHTHINPA